MKNTNTVPVTIHLYKGNKEKLDNICKMYNISRPALLNTLIDAIDKGAILPMATPDSHRRRLSKNSEVPIDTQLRLFFVDKHGKVIY